MVFNKRGHSPVLLIECIFSFTVYSIKMTLYLGHANVEPSPHSQIGHYFFSYLLTCEVYLIEVLELVAQMRQYIFFKPETNKGEFRLYFELFEKKL